MKSAHKFISFMISLIFVSTTIITIVPCPVDALVTVVPSYLQVGDILFLHCQPPFFNGLPYDGWDHVALYIGNNEFVESAPYIPPWVDGVSVHHISTIDTWGENLTYGYVIDASASQRQAAVDFALSQVGRPYQWYDIHSWWANAYPDDPDDPWSDWWYCSELVWASYFHQGINIDVTPEPSPPDGVHDGIHLSVSPQCIADDSDVAFYPSQSPPIKPETPSGPTNVKRTKTYIYSASAVDFDSVFIKYQWDWGEYIGPWYLFPRGSGVTVIRPHTWLTLGTHQVRVRAKDMWEHVGEWSDPLTVTVTSGGGGGGGSTKIVSLADGTHASINNIEIGDTINSNIVVDQFILQLLDSC